MELINKQFINILRSIDDRLKDANIMPLEQISKVSEEEREKIENAGLNLFYGFSHHFDIYDQNNLGIVLSQPNTKYIRMPASKEEIIHQLKREVYDNEALRLHHSNSSQIGQADAIAHQAEKYFFSKYFSSDSWLQDAYQKLGLEGSKEEVFNKLCSLRNNQAILVNKHLNGLFVDVEGTLLKNGSLDETVLNEIKNYENGPVNIWTGGSVTNAIDMLKKQGFPEVLKEMGSNIYNSIPVLSKNALRGASVDMAIDDLSQEELKEQYALKANVYKVMK